MWRGKLWCEKTVWRDIQESVTFLKFIKCVNLGSTVYMTYEKVNTEKERESLVNKGIEKVRVKCEYIEL